MRGDAGASEKEEKQREKTRVGVRVSPLMILVATQQMTDITLSVGDRTTPKLGLPKASETAFLMLDNRCSTAQHDNH